jgi:hypothetical protein
MPQARLVVVNRSGTLLGELSRARLNSVNWTLNKPGALEFVMQSDDPRIGLPKLLGNEVQLWIDDSLEWWGVPWRCTSSPRSSTFSCEGLLSYFTKRFITNASQTFTSVEQFSIAYGLITYAQSGTDQALNIGTASVSPSGVVRSREYLREDHGQILDLLNEFPSLSRAADGVKDGFDFDINIAAGQRLFTPYYPTKGVLRSNMVLEYGRNVTDFTIEEDAVDLANRAYWTGGSNGDVKFENNYKDTVAAADRGEFQYIGSDGDQNDVNVLKQRAANYVATHKTPSITPKVSAVEVPVSMLGVIKVGDTLPVRINSGRVQIASNYRVGGLTWKVQPNNLEIEFMEAVA